MQTLGFEHAGVFSNDDRLAERLTDAGRMTGERVWRLPLDPAYDKMIRSKIADVKNIGGANSGSITAAQFLKRFIEDGTVWAHLDIAGVAWQDGEQKAHDPQLGHGLGRAAAQPAGARALRVVTETLFYHLERRSLEDVLPGLVEKSLERGWRAVIQTDSSERSDALDNLLWTYDDQSFLAHAQSGDGEAARQPVLITVEDENPNGAQILFCVGGAQPADWSDAGFRRWRAW